MNYPTNSMEALQALNGLNGQSSSTNHYPADRFPNSQSATRQHANMPLAPPQNWAQQTHFPQQAQFAQSWSNQAPPQPFQNGMSAVPFLPQQVLHDALALSSPVEPADEPVLVKAILARKGQTYKEALNGLHGTSGHSASLWKDYYLDHKDRIDAAVLARSKQRAPLPLPAKTAKKPALAAYKDSSPQSSSVAKSSSPAPPPKPKPPRRPSQQPARSSHEPPAPSSSGRRRTINSITSHIPEYNPRLPPPNTELKIPEPPSRSPSPPTEIIPHNRGGNKFTAADKEYFIKFISWRLQGDPTLVRHELVELLAEKAPHHNVNSWASYWSTHHDLPDKILAAMRRDEEESEGDEEKEEKPKPKPKKPAPNYAELSSDSELTEAENDEEDEDDENDEDLEIPDADESQMGKSGGSFTQGDLGVVAKHVASFSNWRDASFQDKWTDFARRHPQRAPKSWNEYYRRNQRTFDRLARKIRRLAAESAGGSSQPAATPAKPTWSPDHSGPPRAKRKFVEEESEDSAGKRAKARDGPLL